MVGPLNTTKKVRHRSSTACCRHLALTLIPASLEGAAAMVLPCMQSLLPSGTEFVAAERTEHQHFLDEGWPDPSSQGSSPPDSVRGSVNLAFLASPSGIAGSILLPSQFPTWDAPWLWGSLHPSDTEHSTFTGSPGGNRLTAISREVPLQISGASSTTVSFICALGFCIKLVTLI